MPSITHVDTPAIMKMRITLAPLKNVLRRSARGLKRFRDALRVPPPPSPLADALVTPQRVYCGRYQCEAVRVHGPYAVPAVLRQEVIQQRAQARAATSITRGDTRQRLLSLIDIYGRMLAAEDEDALITVRDPDGELAAIALLSDAPASRALSLDLMASNTASLLGTRPLGPTPGEAALVTCVAMSIRVGVQGALEVQPLPSALHWYRKHGFEPHGVGFQRLGCAGAQRLLAKCISDGH